jgi:hypothetical protein
MKKTIELTLILLVVALGTLSASPINCTPPQPMTVATVSNTFMLPPVGSPTMTCGPLQFSDFQAIAASPGTPTGLDIVAVSPSTFDPATGTVSVSFNPNFTMMGSGIEDIHLYFNVTATSGKQIFGVDGNIGGTNSHFTESICGGAYSGAGGCSSTLAMFTLFSGQSQGVIPITPSTSIGVFKDIQTIGPGALTSFGQTFETSVIPEPGTLAMFGSAIIGLSAVVRRKRSS